MSPDVTLQVTDFREEMCFIEAVDPPQLTAEVMPLRLAHSGKDQHPCWESKLLPRQPRPEELTPLRH